MPLLISAPPGSATTQAALERFRARPGSLLVVPTATMAEHLRNTLVRAGERIRPSSVQTLAAFLDRWSPHAAAPAPLVQFCMERALARQRPPRFREVAEFPGVVRALSELFDLAPGRSMPEDVGRLFGDVERQLAARQMAPRHARLATAAQADVAATGAVQIVLDGFFKFSVGETDLLTALARQVDIVVTLPEGPGADGARQRLAFPERCVTPQPSAGRTVAFTAPNMEREVEEIARRIVDEAARGRPFREMGIVIRSRAPYGPLLETTLARFGVPARAYFANPLAAHPAIQYRMGMIRSALAGWDHVPFLRAVRLPASGLGATARGDALDFEIRNRLPSRGWAKPPSGDPVEWLKRTREWDPELAVEDAADADRIQAWRSTALARAAFDEAVDQAANAFEGSARPDLVELWRQLERVLAQTPLRVPDGRRNVVHILDAYEARQWSLPLVFVPGLVERHFPRYHNEDAIVGDGVLRRAGLETKADREKEESFLFAVAASRATEETVLSYPRFDEAGQPTLPSFFLRGRAEERVDCGVRVYPSPTRRADMPEVEPVPARHDSLSATSIADYLQCPFQFFVRKTLRLRERPKAPRDRLDALLQGNILHRALAEWTRAPLLGTAVLEQVFDVECAEAHVPRTYRTEAVRLELLRHFEAFTQDRQVQLGWTTRVEEAFDYSLNPALRLRGRLDRMDVSPTGQALVIDYKYSLASNMKDRIEEAQDGGSVQAGVYLLAVEHAFGLRPAGMLYCHVKKGVKWDGWHTTIPGLNVGERGTAERVRELARAAEESVLRVHSEITSGRVAVAPRDEKKCRWCAARDVCRKETLARASMAADA